MVESYGDPRYQILIGKLDIAGLRGTKSLFEDLEYSLMLKRGQLTLYQDLGERFRAGLFCQPWHLVRVVKPVSCWHISTWDFR